MSIETYGMGERLRVAARLSGEAFTAEHLILLPIPTTRDKKYITNTEILLKDTLVNGGYGSLVVGYGLPDWYIALATEKKCEILDLSSDEDFLAENAYITAYGTLGYLLTTSVYAPDALKFGIVGYGRIGRALTRILLFLGAKVRVYTSRSLTRLDLGEVGIGSCSSAQLSDAKEDFSDEDIIINTAPKDMRPHFKDGKISHGMRVIELASGNNFEGVEGVEKLPNLPERMYPESAGNAYFAAIKRFMEARK